MVSKKQHTCGHPAGRPTIDELLATRARMNQASAEFLKIDIQTALTFAKIARQTFDNTRKDRSTSAAKKAYDTILRLAKKIDLSKNDQRLVTEGLALLRSELQALGLVV